MMRRLLIAALLVLAACGSRTPAPPPEPEPAEVAACRREARASPEYREVFRRVSPEQSWRLAEELRTVENRLVTACLERQGIRRGGVEPLRR